MLCVSCLLFLQLTANANDVSEVSGGGLVFPTAVAPYGKDRYVVADAALQRIFIVGNNGTITLLAGGGEPNALGSAPGGYADGTRDVARFDAPQGIAADAKGNVYVSDTGNHCIRKITAGGRVSTLAGDPAQAGSRDGTATMARFSVPRGMTLDRNGDLLVADMLVGIRRISASGEVRTLPLPVSLPFDIAILGDPSGATYYVVSDLEGLLIGTPSGAFSRYATENTQVKNDRGTAGGTPIGHPYAVAGYGSHTIIYTDRFTNTVRIIDIDHNYVRTIEPPANDATMQLSEPLGIRLLPDGHSVAIVDAGRRRLSVLQLGVDRAPFKPGGQALPSPPDPSKERIALIGDSMVWWATDWTTSIEGRAEMILNAQPRQRPIEVLPISAPASTAAAQLSYVGEICDTHMADVAAFDLNSSTLRDSYSFTGPVSSPAAVAAWSKPLKANIAAIAERCRSARVRFVVVIYPLLNEVSANEDGLRRLLEGNVTTDPDAHASYLAALNGLPVVDLWPAFTAAEAADGGDHPGLYLLSDAHLSPAGRAVFATAFADAIERLEAGS